MAVMKTHDEMVREWLQDPAFVREYDSLAQEFALFDELLRARKEAGLTQAEVAERMATQPSVVARWKLAAVAEALALVGDVAEICRGGGLSTRNQDGADATARAWSLAPSHTPDPHGFIARWMVSTVRRHGWHIVGTLACGY